MTTAEVETLLRLLAEWEREELALLMQERRGTKQGLFLPRFTRHRHF